MRDGPYGNAPLKMIPSDMPLTRPLVPDRLINQARLRLDALAVATEPHEALAAGFLLHCAVKDAVEAIPEPRPPGEDLKR